MHKVDAPGATPANEFTDGDPQSGVPATTLEAKFMNTVQRELVNVVEQQNIELDAQNDAQLYLALRTMVDNTIAPGTRMLFVQASAPSGWTQDNTLNDRVIRIVNDEGVGGEIGGDWNISGLTFSHTHRISGTANNQFLNQAVDSPEGQGTSFVAPIRHTHNLTGTTISQDANNVASDANWRPAYVDVIACIKN